MLYRISAVIFRFALRVFFKLEIQGADCFPKTGPFILASNHVSFLDPHTVASCSPRKLAIIARDDLFDNKILGFYMRRVGVISLKRDSADIGALKQALAILKTSPLLLFPQGGRMSDLGKAKAGIGFLCRKASVPVIAARVYGTDVILPKGARFFRRGKIKVIFSKVDNIEKNDTNEGIASKVMEKIKSL